MPEAPAAAMPEVGGVLDRRGGQLLATFANAAATVAVPVVAAALLAAWMLTWSTGGTRGPMVHFFYVPVIIAATRFGAGAALAVAVTAGIGAGPLMPLDVAAGTPQTPTNWALRLGFFVLVGALVASLSRRSMPSLRDTIADARARNELHHGIANGQFHVAYQPILHLPTGQVVGVEALARWAHPTRGEIPPAQFIPQAERSDAITALDTYVLREAATQTARWRRTFPSATELWVAVNISAHHLADELLVERLAAILDEVGLPPEALHIEITESALIGDITLAAERVRQLRALGVRVAIDDFGTGQSSLAYLHHFHVDTIKLDRSFAATIGTVTHPRTEILAAAVARLAAELGATTVAEGVETQEQADIMRRLGYHAGQGYHLGRPSAPAHIHNLIAASDATHHPDRRPQPRPTTRDIVLVERPNSLSV